MTRLSLNGEVVALAEPATVEGVVDGLRKGRSGLAVAVNGEVVPRSLWPTTALMEGDQVEVLTAVQGG